MSVLTRVSAVSTWLVVVGLVALWSPPMTIDSLRLGLVLALVVATGALISVALRGNPAAPSPLGVRGTWSGARHPRAMAVDEDSRDLMRMDSDKG